MIVFCKLCVNIVSLNGVEVCSFTLSDENLMTAGIGRNMYLYHPLINIIRYTCCVIDLIPLPVNTALYYSVEF